MKISTYHKNLGDHVYFTKGLNNSEKKWDRIYITTLFTFHYADVIKTVKHYKKFVSSEDNIFIGGIMATLLVSDLRRDTGLKNIISGRLLDSSLLGFGDHVNIDSLPLDYDILYDCDYKYPAGDNFFAYTTRGCVNRCPFCAVPILEGNLNVTNNIIDQITIARANYGDKRNILLMDNNILGISIPDLENIVTNLNELGFINEPNYHYPSKFVKLSDAYYRFKEQAKSTADIAMALCDCLDALLDKNIAKKWRELINKEISNIGCLYNDKTQMILDNIDMLAEIEKTYSYKKSMQRYVDFNQGMDARLLTEEKMAILSKLPIKPFRIAFDNIKYEEIYLKAIRLASHYGVKEFSNYLLYNFEDSPEELYKRIKINVDLSEEIGSHIYSFPMKYEPIENKSRGHIGTNWNNHYLRSVKAILNVSKGVFGGNRSFFERAFGADEQEFFEILAMPKDILTYRNYYEEIGITRKWRQDFNQLSEIEKNEVLRLISQDEYCSKNTTINYILKYYRHDLLDKKRNIISIAI
jgi:hypothetical protein